jgi:hypothetical protein
LKAALLWELVVLQVHLVLVLLPVLPLLKTQVIVAILLLQILKQKQIDVAEDVGEVVKEVLTS